MQKASYKEARTKRAWENGLDNWLKVMVATACVVVIAAGGVFAYDRYQSYVEEQREAKLAAYKAQMQRKAEERLQKQLAAIDAKNNAIEAEQDAQRQRIVQAKNRYFSREKSATGEGKKCFSDVRTMYEFGGRDALDTMRKDNSHLIAVQNCILAGLFTEEEVRAIVN